MFAIKCKSRGANIIFAMVPLVCELKVTDSLKLTMGIEMFIRLFVDRTYLMWRAEAIPIFPLFLVPPYLKGPGVITFLFQLDTTETKLKDGSSTA